MLGYVIAKPKKPGARAGNDLAIPPDLRRRLKSWIDVDEVGPAGFWIWLRAVVPLLPQPDRPSKRTADALGSPREMIRQLEQRLTIFAREQSRLSVLCDQALHDNELLVRRLRALEAALRTLQLAGHSIAVPADADIEAAIERYSPAARWRPNGSSRSS